MKCFYNTLMLIVLIAFMLPFLSSCGGNATKTDASNDNTFVPSGDLVLFHAGSLSVPVKLLSDAFKAKYPLVNIMAESAGSVSCARKITDLGKMCDVFISADYMVINNMLIPEYANWNIKFAGNEMALVYTDKSRHAKDINAENWHTLLRDNNTRYGRSDPNADPCGYRTVLTLRLAEKYYGIKGLADDIMSRHHNYIRPKEVDLLALLETGTIDYIFLYRSVAVQHHLPYVILPDAINLKSDSLADFYKEAQVSINGSKPGEMQTIYGEPMAYGITIPLGANNPKTALAFVHFLLSDEGRRIIEENGQTSLLPSESEFYSTVPDTLKTFVKP